VLTGLRRGEVLALRWADLDLSGDEPRLFVRGTLKRQKGVGLVVDRPKTDAATREVALADVVATALRNHRRSQNELRLQWGGAWPDSDFVFTTPIGTPVDPANFRRTHLHVCDVAGLGARRFHALRHTWATLALAEGVPLEVVSKNLGHAGLAITADVYAHVGEKATRTAVDAVANLMRPA
jgi:integrase